MLWVGQQIRGNRQFVIGIGGGLKFPARLGTDAVDAHQCFDPIQATLITVLRFQYRMDARGAIDAARTVVNGLDQK